MANSWPATASLLRVMSWRDVITDTVWTQRLLGYRPPSGLHIKNRLLRRSRVFFEPDGGELIPGLNRSRSYPVWIGEQFERELQLKQRWREVVDGGARADRSLRVNANWEFGTPPEISFFEWLDTGVSRLQSEFRLPYLELRLFQFLLALPPYPWCCYKAIVRLAMRSRLPRAVVERPKTNLPANPLYLLMSGDLEPMAQVAAMPELQRFVDTAKLLQIGSTSPLGWQAPVNLRLQSLGYWLRSRG